ncbi:MAG TPA: class I SAM-dependent methyltransferase [Roseiflexaceae bacterium]|nr:class I SAM-dependent methyltransferase [Roseiflexaceae bacterium]
MNRNEHEANRISWNEATRVHNSHKADQARFLREGGSTLFPEEIELLGDIRGKRLVHLQCNAGQDTLSLAARGALVTGVDISDEAIDFARRLSQESGIPGTFERADVYDWLEQHAGGERFDIVFSSYGAVIWLSNLAAWARGIAGVLRPGGFFTLVEFHPFIGMFDEEMRLAYPYGGGQPIAFENGIGDYVAWAGEALTPSGYLEGVKDFVNPNPGYEYAWGLSDVVTALLDAGLILEVFREYPYANGFPALPGTRLIEGGRYTAGEGQPTFPMMYGLRARKRGYA